MITLKMQMELSLHFPQTEMIDRIPRFRRSGDLLFKNRKVTSVFCFSRTGGLYISILSHYKKRCFEAYIQLK